MATRDRVVLLRHPCIYEELIKDMPVSAPPDISFEVEDWGLDDPKYMFDPLNDLVLELSERVRLKRLHPEADSGSFATVVLERIESGDGVPEL